MNDTLNEKKKLMQYGKFQCGVGVGRVNPHTPPEKPDTQDS